MKYSIFSGFLTLAIIGAGFGKVDAQVVIGGNYNSAVTTGSVTNSASGGGAEAKRCIGGIEGGDKPVRIGGDVTVVVNGVQQPTADAGCISDSAATAAKSSKPSNR